MADVVDGLRQRKQKHGSEEEGGSLGGDATESRQTKARCERKEAANGSADRQDVPQPAVKGKMPSANALYKLQRDKDEKSSPGTMCNSTTQGCST